MIVDCHIHAWRYPEHFNREVTLANQPPTRSAEPWTEEHLKEMWDWPIELYLKKMAGVDKAIIQGAHGWTSVGIVVPNDYLAETANRYPDKFEWCCVVDPRDKGAAKEVERCVKELGAIGIGEVGPPYENYFANDKRCYPVYEKAQELGVPINIHAGFTFYRTSRALCSYPLYVDDVAITFPKLKIVFCHFGYYKSEDVVLLMQKHENVFADVSELVDYAGLTSTPRFRPPVIKNPYYALLRPLLFYFSQARGYDSDKLMWGTEDCDPRESLQIWTHINDWTKKYDLPEIPEERIHNILHENWKRVYTFRRAI